MRFPPAVHQRLVAAARADGLSLNEYCVRRLARPDTAAAPGEDAARLLARAEAVAPGQVIGIVLYGSWARGEASAASDVGALIVVETALPLSRALYRLWDAAPVQWQERRVDAHFVHPPADATRPGSVWAEVAVDGQVVHDGGGRIAVILAAVRGAIADGRLLRRRAHGQPYWTEVA